MAETIELNGLPSAKNNITIFNALTFFLKSCPILCHEKYWIFNKKIEKCLLFFQEYLRPHDFLFPRVLL